MYVDGWKIKRRNYKLACNENCLWIDDCAPWQTRLSEVSNYCKDYVTLDYVYWFNYGETIWNEMSYNKFCENCLDTEEDDWDLFVKESAY